VISAVGHEVDITVCDAVADLRAATPSAAAAAACVARDEIEKAFALARRDLSEAIAARVRHARLELDGVRKHIGQASERVAAAKRSVIGTAAARLNALSPLATLSRGYAVARDADGSALTSARQFKRGLEFELLLHDGSINAETKSIK
jgi:exodeoxyribonuclease VII large subunit